MFQTLNILLPSIKFRSTKHLWKIIAIGCVNKETVRGMVRLTTNKIIILRGTYILRDEEEYIVATEEMDGTHGLSKYTIRLKNEL